jgi:hypothetical protein
VPAITRRFPVTPDENHPMLEKAGQELRAVRPKFAAHPSWSGLDDPLKIKVIKRVRADITKNRVVDLAPMRAAQ